MRRTYIIPVNSNKEIKGSHLLENIIVAKYLNVAIWLVKASIKRS